MNEHRVSYEKIHEEFCDFIDSCGKYSFYTRSTEMQHQKVSECEKYLGIIKQYKLQVIEKNNEYAANQFFHMQCMINALKSSLFMWIDLKKNDFENSWTHLVDAQEYTSIALKALCVNIEVASNEEANYGIFPSSKVRCAEKSLAS
jgi:hypothetical protein